jgi:DNA polymerase-3 subunit alpha
LNELGHPAQVLLGLDDAIAAGQATQRDRISGQTSLFDLGADDAAAMERPLPQTTEVPVPERLRWEKELLGLYLSAHPMGEVAEQVGQFVTAYSSDLKDESLDGQRVVIGGIVTGFRTVITKSRSTMGVATLEDLQGTIEVVVFPRLYETTAGTWTEGTILLVAGRIDHRGEEVSLLADLVTDWDGAIMRGPEAFAREVAAGERGRGPRRGGGPSGGPGGRPLVPVGPGPLVDDRALVGAAASGIAGGIGARNDLAAIATNGNGASAATNGAGPAPDEIRPGVPRVSPLRAEAQGSGALPAIAPAEPIPTYHEPPGLSDASGPGFAERDDEPALPDEARARAASESAAPTSQVESQPDQVLHVRFGGAAPDRLVLAMEAFHTLLRERPGATRVILHVPAPSGGSALPMELSRRVAYDAELLSEVRRRLGNGLVDLRLGG